MSKRVFLSVDGGGTKLRMLLFDDCFRVLGEGLCGGVNQNSTTEADARANVRDCLLKVFTQGVPEAISKLYYVFVGNAGLLLDGLTELTKVNEAVPMSEPVAGLLSGALWRSGILALSGTGSDVFLVPGGSPPLSMAGSERLVVGAWGPILGDDGSGVWIGHRAVRAAIAGLEGWAEPTVIMDLIRRDWQLKHDRSMCDIVYRSHAPFRKLGSLTKIVGEAARMEDKVAQGILCEAGRLMAAQTVCLVNRFRIPAEDYRLVSCGGAWKAHPLMFEAFRKELAVFCPGLPVRRHRFEHVMAGPALEMLEATGDAACAEGCLAERFPAYVVNW